MVETNMGVKVYLKQKLEKETK